MKRPQLFLLHFAGGNYYSFRFLKPYLSCFEVVCLELPGRGNRGEEPLLKDFEAAAIDLYDQIITKLKSNKFMIYGHSMGAYLGLRVANLLENSGNYLTGLVVSGNPGPGIFRSKKNVNYLLNKSEFISELRTLGGMSKDLLENEEIFSFFEPVLRADFEIAERNQLAVQPPINAKLFAIMGSEEENVAQIDNWSRFTKGDFKTLVLEGNHFFIYDHPRRIADIIFSFYSES